MEEINFSKKLDIIVGYSNMDYFDEFKYKNSDFLYGYKKSEFLYPYDFNHNIKNQKIVNFSDFLLEECGVKLSRILEAKNTLYLEHNVNNVDDVYPNIYNLFHLNEPLRQETQNTY